MRALVTGLAGFVGSHLADYLLAETDWEIFGMVRWQESLDNIAHLIPRINRGERIHLIYGDLRDTISVQGVVEGCNPHYVFHLAAQSYPVTSFTSPLDTLDTNVQGTARLLDALRGLPQHAQIHICSSSEVYGRVTQDELPIDENCRLAPSSPYAISKIGTDMLGQFYAETYGMNVQVTRMFTHSGARRGDVFAESSFAKQIAMVEAGMLDTVKVGNLNSLRTIADVRDAVRAYHMLLTVNPVAGAIYNIGGSHSCTVGEILEYLISLSGRKIDYEVDTARLRPLDADLQVPDCRKFKANTGWEPKIPFEETMMDLLTYWRERVKRGEPLQR